MIEVRNITKIFSDELGLKQVLLNNLSFNIADEKITSIIAPVSSGKSTLLKIISDLENPTDGSIINSSRKKIIYLPSLPSSFPWLSVKQNMLVGRINNSDDRFNSIINLVGLEGYENHRPHNSSDGFRFRISLARSLNQNPSLIILDEPFKMMKQESREELYLLVKEINKTIKTSFLIATSDVSEALCLADVTILMKKDPMEVIPLQIQNTPAAKNWINNNFEEFLKIKNQIEISLKGNDLNR